ncbi:hypothetical protein NN561_010272 [Cricetulus griseus]
MQTSFALLSPPYPESGRTDAGRRGGSRTEPPVAARTSMKAHLRLPASARSAGDPAALASARPDPSSAPPWAMAPSARPVILTGLRSLLWPPRGQVPTLRSDSGPAAQTPFPTGPRDDRSRLRSRHTLEIQLYLRRGLLAACSACRAVAPRG